MRHSGIEWIGEIPKEWKESKTLYVLSMPITDGPHTTPDLFDNGIPFISADAVSDGFINFDNKRGFISKSFYEECCKKYIPQRDDIYMIKSGASTGQTAIVETDEIFTIWSPLAVFRANKNIMIPRFLLYVLRSEGYQKQVENNWSYGTQQNIGMRTLEGLIVSYPNIDEQQKIANYLDKVCGEVDEMIALQEQMIEELKAYKQSVITEAVTKGLNPNVPMKDSGIDWIGEVPEGWKICRIKNVAALFGRIGFRGYTSDDLNKDGEGAITLSPSNMMPMCMDYSKVTYLSWKKYEESPEIMIQNGDLLMVKTGSSYGKVSYVDKLPREATINPQILRIVPSINSKYLGYYMQTDLFIYQVEGGVVGGTIPTISQEKINNFYVILPIDREQQSIASYLDTKCAEIDALIAIKQAKIDELKDYKKSVIYEYVTGKKEVTQN